MNNKKSDKESVIKKLINLFKKEPEIKNNEQQSASTNTSKQYIEIMSPPYGVSTKDDWAMVREIDYRRRNNISLNDLFWPESEDPLSPANNRKHPYYIYHE